MTKFASSITNRSTLVTPSRTQPPLTVVKGPAEPQRAIWTPSVSGKAGPLITSDVLHVPPEALPHGMENKIIEAICRPLQPGEGHATGNANREGALRQLFGTLDVTQAFHLRRRLEIARADDPLCSHFHRIVVDRRQRLLQFLGDARRRAAAQKR